MQMGTLMKETIRWWWFYQLWANLPKNKWVFYQTKMPGNIWMEFSAKRWKDLRRCSLRCLRWSMEYSKRQLPLILEREPQLKRFSRVSFLLTSGRKTWNTTVSICRWNSRGTSRTWPHKIWGSILGNIFWSIINDGIFINFHIVEYHKKSNHQEKNIPIRRQSLSNIRENSPWKGAILILV